MCGKQRTRFCRLYSARVVISAAISTGPPPPPPSFPYTAQAETPFLITHHCLAVTGISRIV